MGNILVCDQPTPSNLEAGLPSWNTTVCIGEVREFIASPPGADDNLERDVEATNED